MADHQPGHHSNKWYKNHPEVKRPPAPSAASYVARNETTKKSWSKRFAGPLFAFVTNVVLTVLDAKGYLRGIPDGALGVAWFACFVYWAWAEGHIRTVYTKHKKASISLIVVIAIMVAAAVEYRSHLISFVLRSKDAPFVKPSNKLVKFEGNLRSDYRHCYGLPDEKEIECLCPRPVDYELYALPTPTDNNYATRVEIKKGKDSMYRVQLFSRTPMQSGGIDGDPYGPGKAGLAVVEWADDRYTFMLTSSAPEDLFKLDVKTSEGLRLKCINQIN